MQPNMDQRTPYSDFLIPDYLLQRLSEIGVDHLFGVPGDLIMPFFKRISASNLEYVGCCNELNAGYAADGYARVQGIGAAIVTGGVGALSIINAVAGAYAEDVPLIVISGGPSAALFKTQPKTHHTIPGNFRAPLKMMAEVTAASILLDDPATATLQIDEAITVCLSTRKPVYIEIPVNIQKVACEPPTPLAIPNFVSQNPSEAVTLLVADMVAKIGSSERTVICVGHEVERFQLQTELRALVEKTGLPVASMMFGKAGYVETLNSCVGLYMGAISPEDIRNYVEESDIVLFIGAHETDMNMGIGTSKLQPEQTVFVRENEAVINAEVCSNIPLGDFIVELSRQMEPVDGLRFQDQPIKSFVYKTADQFQPIEEAALTTTRFYQRLVHFIQPGDVIAADTSAGINSANFQLREDNISITTPYWASMGMCFGAAVGASFAPKLSNRVIAIEGDGSLLMTIQELSTLARYKKPSIVFVLNNNGYTFERLIHDGEFNDIPEWRYNKLVEVIPGCNSLEVRTEGDLERALLGADTYTEQGPLIIELYLDAQDVPELFDIFTRHFRS
jgi:TPP-dependent 2-oxoacid decarboxylase